MGDVTKEQLMEVAEQLSRPDQLLHNHVCPVTGYDLYSAKVKAGALGKSRKALLSNN